MNKRINEIRRFLFTCSGEDNSILERCKTKIQVWFAAIGFFVLLIFFGCIISAYFFTNSLFNGALWVSIPIGIFWGAMIVNIYLLLLHTISPAIIPLAAKKKSKKEKENTEEIKATFLTLSMFLRLSFMMLLAIIIAQPLNVYLLKSSIAISLEKHKLLERVKLYATTNQSLINNELEIQKDFHRRIKTKLSINEDSSTDSHFQIIKSKIDGDSIFLQKASFAIKKLEKLNTHWSLTSEEKVRHGKLLANIDSLLENELQSDQDFADSLVTLNIPLSIKSEFADFKTNIIPIINDKTSNYNALNTLLESSNFYVKTIQLLLVENPLSWVITLFVCFIFFIPILLKYQARDISAKMFIENNKEDLNLIRLRQELIKTNDFKWLEKNIKKIDASKIRTTDYYFQRMLIEHKMILEEYDNAKKQYSNILTDNVKLYNKTCQKRLQPLLEKLKKISVEKYNEAVSLINKEYKDEQLVKYEYWLDCPFRTKRFQQPTIIENQVGLLDFVYKSNNDDEI